MKRKRKLRAGKNDTNKLRAGKNDTNKLLALRSPVTIEIAAAAGDKPAGPATFAGVAYAGGVLPGYTAKLDLDVVVDLKGMKSTRNLVANLDHNKTQRVGHVTEFVNDKKSLNLAGVLSAATPYRDEVQLSAASGFNWEVSIETELANIVKLAAGKKATVNGREVVGPLYIARKSTLSGVAFVSQGADVENNVRIAASRKSSFEAWLEGKGWEADELTDDQRATLQASYDREQGREPDRRSFDDDSLEAMAAAERRDNERREKIRLLARRAMKQSPGSIDQIELLASKAVEEIWDAEKFELALLRNLGPQSGEFRPRSRQPIDGRVLEAALCLASGLPNVEKVFPAEILEAVDTMRLRHISLQQVLLQAAAANGYDARPGERITQGNLRTILEYAFPPATDRRRLEANFSTIALPNILGNVANKEILAGFAEEDQTWREIAAVKSVSNFHQVTSYRMTDELEYEEVPADGKINHGTLGEDSYTRQAKTYAKMLGISRTNIINDDLGAFADIRARLGRGAARKFNKVFWARFLNNATFFTTARGNLITGTDTSLYSGTSDDTNGLSAGVLAFRQLRSGTNDGAKRISGRPEILLVPPELEFIARRFYVSTNVNSGGNSTDSFLPNSNIHAGLYRPVICDFLSDSEIHASASALAWYLLRNPAVLAAMVVSFLNGMQTPTVESTNADFDTLGVLFRGFHDFGCDQAEYLAGVKAKGEA